MPGIGSGIYTHESASTVASGLKHYLQSPGDTTFMLLKFFRMVQSTGLQPAKTEEGEVWVRPYQRPGRGRRDRVDSFPSGIEFVRCITIEGRQLVIVFPKHDRDSEHGEIHFEEQ